jgi:hypothetical protein
MEELVKVRDGDGLLCRQNLKKMKQCLTKRRYFIEEISYESRFRR